MVATQQHVRHPHSTVLARSRIVWVLRSTAQFQTERLLHSTPHVPQHTRHLAHAGFQHGHGSQLSARQDIGTYRQLSTGEQLRDPCINPSYRPHSKTTSPPDPASSRATPSSKGRPPGDMTKTSLSSRTLSGATANTPSSAAATTSTRITIPGPPTYGESSTCLWLRGVNSRISCTAKSMTPFSTASEIGCCSLNHEKASGTRVNTSHRIRANYPSRPPPESWPGTLPSPQYSHQEHQPPAPRFQYREQGLLHHQPGPQRALRWRQIQEGNTLSPTADRTRSAPSDPPVQRDSTYRLQSPADPRPEPPAGNR